ncbi:hypothetical protein BKA93DRAFT_748231 [Sparassis latifolia]
MSGDRPPSHTTMRNPLHSRSKPSLQRRDVDILQMYCMLDRVGPGSTVEVRGDHAPIRHVLPLPLFLWLSLIFTLQFNDPIRHVHSQKFRIVYLPPEEQALPEKDGQPPVRQYPDAYMSEESAVG